MISVKIGEDFKTASVGVKESVVSSSPFLKGTFHLKTAGVQSAWQSSQLLTAMNGILR